MQETNSEILLYKTEDGEIKIDVYFDAYNYAHPTLALFGYNFWLFFTWLYSM